MLSRRSLLFSVLHHSVSLVLLSVTVAGSLSAQITSMSPNAATTTPGFGGFYAAPYYASGNANVIATLTGDFNHDGKPDVVTVNSAGGASVQLDDGTGKLGTPIASPGVTRPSQFTTLAIDSAVAADLNGDGYTDLIVGASLQLSSPQMPALFVMLNQKNGKFGPAKTIYPSYPSSNYQNPVVSYSFGVAQTTASGHKDIVVASEYLTGTYEIVLQTFLNGGSGSFAGKPVQIIPASLQTDIGIRVTPVFSDVNHDGKIDMLVERDYGDTGNTNDYVYVLLGNGDGTFELPTAAKTVTFPGQGLNTPSSQLVVASLTSDASSGDLILNNGVGIYTALSNGDGTYKVPRLIPGPFKIAQVLVDDLNGDGKNDLLTNSYGVLTSYLGKGDGTFGPIASTALAYGNYGAGASFYTVAADFNGDGTIDFGNGDSNGNVQVALGNGDGSFHAAPALYSNGSPELSPNQLQPYAALDLNGDGVPDLVSSSSLGVFVSGLATGKGGFTYRTALNIPSSSDLTVLSPTVGDFNGDGKQDVVLVSHTGGDFGVALSNGDGTLKVPVVTKPPMDLPCQFLYAAAGDINGDGKLDLIFSYSGNPYCSASGENTVPPGLVIALGNGDGSFKPPTFIETGYYPAAIALARLRGKNAPLDLIVGESDYVSANTYSYEVSILQGKGNGTFSEPVTIVPGALPAIILTDDFNNDGKADLTLIGSGSSGPTPEEGAFLFTGNGDGSFNPSTVINTISNNPYGSYGATYADVNGDGILDLVGNFHVGFLSVYLGTGNGSFRSPVEYLFDSYGGPMVAGRYLGDNALSVLAPAFESGTAFFMNQGGSSLTVKASAASIMAGQSVTLSSALTATLADQPAPTGTISFYDGANLLGTSSIDGSLATAKLAVGAHAITAKYSGDTHFNPNASTIVTVTVTGASASTLAVSPASLAFATTAMGQTSAAQTVTVKNTGKAAITLDATSFTGTNTLSFVVSAKTCGTTLAAGASCTYSIEFKPAKTGALSASLNIADSATGSPQLIALKGTATAAAPLAFTVSPASLTFPATAVGTSSKAQTVTLKNSGSSAATLGTVAFTGENTKSFVVSSRSCGSSLAVGASCTFSIEFEPAKTGALSASLSIADSATGSPQMIALQGTGSQ